MSASLLLKLTQERQSQRAKLTAALQEDPEDPLALYETFIKWTNDNYSPQLIPQSGLLELVEEAARRFRDDDTYKSDRRYLKLWLTYASYVEDDHDGAAVEVYNFCLKNGIGTNLSQLYEEFAATLERSRRLKDADKIFFLGIKRRARPVERLQKHYNEFKARADAKKQVPRYPPLVPPAAWQDAPSEARALRRDPLMNINGARKSAPAPPSSSSSTQPAASTSKHDRYAVMLAPPAPGRRPENLRFDLSLLFTPDGTEYCSQEVRAKSMGLLGKKWGPPPPPEPARPTYRKAYVEPTMTMATKEALADVFGMYNSPEKTTRFGAIAGSKHAPVRMVESITPMASLTAVAKTVRGQEAAANKASASFRATNAQPEDDTIKLEKSLSETKFQIFTDDSKPSLERTPAPSNDRRVLSTKLATPAASDENAHSRKRALGAKTPTALAVLETKKLDESQELPPIERVFTPIAPSENRPTTLSKKDIFIDKPEEKEEKPASKFAPFVDSGAKLSPPEPAFKVFTKPAANENVPPSSKPPGVLKPAFTPFVDEEPESSPPRPILADRSQSPRSHTPLQTYSTPSTSTDDDGEFYQYDEHLPPQEDYDESDSTDQSDMGDAAVSQYNYVDTHTPAHSDLDDSESYDSDGSRGPTSGGYQAHGRLGKFNVMTPITERTLEYTTTQSLSVRGTPSDGLGGSSRVFSHLHSIEAKESADMLAAELAEEEDDEGDIGEMEERTGTLSLSDALTAASSFNPPNPCNPFEGPIISAMLSFLPPDPDFQDLRMQDSNQLDVLQKFAKKKLRRASGGSSRGSSDDSVRVTLNGRKYDVLDKLGEGGFGAVFEAVDLTALAAKRGDRDDDDESEDEDEDETPKVALKVVKPRSLWEFHVLRRIHHTLSPSLKRSIITPEALYAFRDESFLVLELCKQGTLLNVVNGAPSAGISQQGACLDELLVMFFTIELMRLLEGMHRAGFIHGDMKIDNCLLRLEDVPGPASAWSAEYNPSGEGGWAYKGIKLIDFGRTIDTRLFPAGQKFIGDWDADPRDCIELQEGKPWTYQTDYFGLAGIIYCMLYGKYIEASSITPTASPAAGGRTRYKLSAPFKRYWQGDLWARLFDTLLNSGMARPDGALPLCDELAALRVEMETWLHANCNRASNSLKGLLKKIGLMILGGKDGKFT